ncbi:MAG: hypothetical protein K8T89_03905, partial [Planctomycetes bacterium]|nr:hypothetical protein [Planctomycetota bacterium]
MRLSEDATLYIRIWTALKCVACGTDFQYLRRITVQRRDTNFNATQASVEAEYRRDAEQTAELCPCPQCGWIQPDMEGGLRADRHFNVTLLGLVFLIVELLATAFVLLPALVGHLVATGIAVGGLLLHLLRASGDANRDRQKNLDLARKRMEEDTLRLIKSGEAMEPPTVPRDLRMLILAISLLLAAAFLFISPLLGLPFMPTAIPGLILFIAGGSTFAT